MLSRLYKWTMAQAAHRHAARALAAVSFIESSIFPIPPDVMLLPMILARRERAWAYAALATAASVAGALVGYGLGFFLFDTIGRPLLEFYGYMDKFAAFQTTFNDQGAWLVFFFGITFFPFKVITIASGVAQLNLTVFLLASLAARSLRFFIVAGLLWLFGEPVRQFVEKRLALVTTVVMALLLGGFALVKFL